MSAVAEAPENAAAQPRPNVGEAIVSVRGLTKTFKDFWGRPKARAVDNVDFEVRRGEVFGLLGPNGSGKSTTVKMLLGLLYPTRGTLRFWTFSAARQDQGAHRLSARGIVSLPLSGFARDAEFFWQPV
jgi:ABC-type multidrug transport system ATPase subunit